jgi:predicted transcriptional regulator
MPNLTFRTDDTTKKELEHIATTLDRSQGWVINAALEAYLEHQRWISDAIQTALDQVENGTATLIPHDEVKAHFTAKFRR